MRTKNPRRVEKHALPVFRVPIVALPPPAQPCPKNAFPLFFGGSRTPLPLGYCYQVKRAPVFIGLRNHVFTTLATKWAAQLGLPRMVSGIQLLHTFVSPPAREHSATDLSA